MKKAILAICSILAIIGSLGFMAARATRTDQQVRELYQERKVAFCCDRCGEVQLTMREWANLREDPATGYRACPVCGHYSLASHKRMCASCKKPVGWPPPPNVWPEEYRCPHCGGLVLPKSTEPSSQLDGGRRGTL